MLGRSLLPLLFPLLLLFPTRGTERKTMTTISEREDEKKEEREEEVGVAMADP